MLTLIVRFAGTVLGAYSGSENTMLLSKLLCSAQQATLMRANQWPIGFLSHHTDGGLSRSSSCSHLISVPNIVRSHGILFCPMLPYHMLLAVVSQTSGQFMSPGFTYLILCDMPRKWTTCTEQCRCPKAEESCMTVGTAWMVSLLCFQCTLESWDFGCDQSSNWN